MATVETKDVEQQNDKGFFCLQKGGRFFLRQVSRTSFTPVMTPYKCIIMKKPKQPPPKIMRATACDGDPSRQVIPQKTKGLTVINHITFQFFSETQTSTATANANDADNEWEAWAATHKRAALGDAA